MNGIHHDTISSGRWSGTMSDSAGRAVSPDGIKLTVKTFGTLDIQWD
jgi:hypothetical protein